MNDLFRITTVKNPIFGPRLTLTGGATFSDEYDLFLPLVLHFVDFPVAGM